MKNWKDIKKDIYSSQEPLKTGAWEEMDNLLNQSGKGRKYGRIVVLGVFVFLIGCWLIFSDRDSPQFHQELPATNQAPIHSQAPMLNDVDTSTQKNQESGQTENYKEEEVSLYKKSTKPLIIKEATELRIEEVEGAFHNPKEDRKTWRTLLLPKKNLKAFKPTSAEEQLIRVTSGGQYIDATSHQSAKVHGASRFEIRLFAGPEYSLNTLKYVSEAGKTHKEFDEATENAVQPGLGWDAGIELRYRIWKSFRVSSGLGLRRQVTENHYRYTVNEVPVIDSASGNILAYLPSNQPIERGAEGSNTYTYLSVPLSLTYEYPVSEKWALTGEAVYQLNFLIDHSGTEVDPKSLELKESGADMIKGSAGAYQLRIGLRYQIKKNLFLALEPSYRSTISDVYQDKHISWRPKDIGLSLTTTYRFERN